MAGNFFVCPDGESSLEPNGTVACSVPWEIHHTDEISNQLMEVLKVVFELPPIDQLQLVFGVVVTTLFSAYMTAWGCGKILSMFNDNQGERHG